MTGNAALEEVDKDLADLLKKGGEEAYLRIYDRYAPAVFGVLIRTLKDHTLAESCMQDSFCELWKRRMEYDPLKERLFTWMLKMVRNAVTRLVKQDTADQEIRECIDLVCGMDVGAFMMEKKKNDGANFLAGIDEQTKKAITLIYFEGHRFSNVAQELGISVEALRGKMMVTIKKLKVQY